ncbi:MAG: hypothetical protein RL338_1729 [Chloroflexota bacterium]
MSRETPSLRSSALRTATLATAIVALGYVALSAAVVLLISANLTRAVDARLLDGLARLESGESPRPGRGFDEPGGGRRFGPAVLVWTELPDGRVASTVGARLPVAPSAITAPISVVVEGIEVRLAGRGTPAGHVVVGQSLEAVAAARSTAVTATLLVAPVLLLVVFAGAFAVGRRAGAPIEAARRRQQEFTADASHELRTPLAVIEAQTSLGLAAPRDVAWHRNALERIDGEVRRMRGLVDDMLWLARFDAARGGVVAEPVDLPTVAAAAADRFATVAASRGIAIETEIDAAAGAVTAPAEWLDRLVGVLVDNACRYARAGGRIRVAVAARDGRVVLTVDDDGPGIPEAERARIFDRFHRATEVDGGTGLGLSIGDAIVRSSGGRWTVGESPLGGASLSVAWPRAPRGGGPG